MTILGDAAREAEAQLNSIRGLDTHVYIDGDELKIDAKWEIGGETYQFAVVLPRHSLAMGRFCFITKAAQRILAARRESGWPAETPLRSSTER